MVRRSFIRRFRRDERGATAIEFAFVAPVLIFLMFSIIELGFMLYLRSAVETATQIVARRAITGNFAGEIPANRQQLFNDMLRQEVGQFLLANTTLQVTTTIWSSLSQPSRVGGGNIGGANQIVRYQVDCTYKFMTPLIGWLNSGSSDNLHIQATAFVKNEAY
ncbi:MAG TPA: pilus assembly protein [Beijerinckiaceae bacterium]|nr:pilus assembly protein [Beijerinckiaceae bacterium]